VSGESSGADGRRTWAPSTEAGLVVCLAALYLAGLVVDGRAASGPGTWLAVVTLVVGVVGAVIPLERIHPRAGLVYVAATMVLIAVALTVLDTAPHVLTLFVYAAFVWAGARVDRQGVLQLLPVVLLLTLLPVVIVDRTVGGVIAIGIAIGVGVWTGLLLADAVEDQQETVSRSRAAEQARVAITRAFAHDIGQPLTVISGNLELMEHRPDLARRDRQLLVASANRHAQRLTRLARGLLDTDRVQHGRLRLDRRPVDLSRLIQRAAQLAEVEVEVDVHPDAATVEVDPDRFEQVVVNLLVNARRHGRPPVVVVAAGTTREVELRVRDHGPGLDPDELPHLFDAYRAPERIGGAGLGLSIARWLVEAHGGTVRAVAADPGLEIVVTVPRVTPDGAGGRGAVRSSRT
jgi:signal transduction histidine kinase